MSVFVRLIIVLDVNCYHGHKCVQCSREGGAYPFISDTNYFPKPCWPFSSCWFLFFRLKSICLKIFLEKKPTWYQTCFNTIPFCNEGACFLLKPSFHSDTTPSSLSYCHCYLWNHNHLPVKTAPRHLFVWLQQKIALSHSAFVMIVLFSTAICAWWVILMFLCLFYIIILAKYNNNFHATKTLSGAEFALVFLWFCL